MNKNDLDKELQRELDKDKSSIEKRLNDHQKEVELLKTELSDISLAEDLKNITNWFEEKTGEDWKLNDIGHSKKDERVYLQSIAYKKNFWSFREEIIVLVEYWNQQDRPEAMRNKNNLKFVVRINNGYRGGTGLSYEKAIESIKDFFIQRVKLKEQSKQ
jgi:hypothetical protein